MSIIEVYYVCYMSRIMDFLRSLRAISAVISVKPRDFEKNNRMLLQYN